MDTDSIDSSDSESDLFLGILDYFDPETLLRFSEVEPRSFADLDEYADSHESTGSLPTSAPPSVGTPSTKLEAINELIHFDHFYHKPLAEAGLVESGENAVKIEEASLSTAAGYHEPIQVELKQEPLEDGFITQLGLGNILSAERNPDKPQGPLDSYSDSGYEESASPVSDMSSPLTLENNWEDTFTSELFPQLSAV